VYLQAAASCVGGGIRTARCAQLMLSPWHSLFMIVPLETAAFPASLCHCSLQLGLGDSSSRNAPTAVTHSDLSGGVRIIVAGYVSAVLECAPNLTVASLYKLPTMQE